MMDENEKKEKYKMILDRIVYRLLDFRWNVRKCRTKIRILKGSARCWTRYSRSSRNRSEYWASRSKVKSR